MSKVTDLERTQVELRQRKVARYERKALEAVRKVGWRCQRAAIAGFKRGSATFIQDAISILGQGRNHVTQAALAAFVVAYGERMAQATLQLASSPKQMAPFDTALKTHQRIAAIPTERLQELAGEMHAKSVLVWHKMGAGVEADLRKAVDDIVAQGMHVQDGVKRLGQAFEASGITPVNSFQLEAITRTQVQLAYSAGIWQADQHEAFKDLIWGYKYVTVGDDRVRPNHAALDGLLMKRDSPTLENYWPPNGWACRCDVIALDHEPEGYEPPDLMALPLPDPGFDYNPGRVFQQVVSEADVPFIVTTPQQLATDDMLGHTWADHWSAEELKQLANYYNGSNAAPALQALDKAAQNTLEKTRLLYARQFGDKAFTNLQVGQLVSQSAHFSATTYEAYLTTHKSPNAVLWRIKVPEGMNGAHLGALAKTANPGVFVLPREAQMQVTKISTEMIDGKEWQVVDLTVTKTPTPSPLVIAAPPPQAKPTPPAAPASSAPTPPAISDLVPATVAYDPGLHDTLAISTAASKLGLKYDKAYDMMKTGKLKGVKVGGKWHIAFDKPKPVVEWLPIKDAAAKMGIKYDKAYDQMKAGKLKGQKIDGKWHIEVTTQPGAKAATPAAAPAKEIAPEVVPDLERLDGVTFRVEDAHIGGTTGAKMVTITSGPQTGVQFVMKIGLSDERLQNEWLANELYRKLGGSQIGLPIESRLGVVDGRLALFNKKAQFSNVTAAAYKKAEEGFVFDAWMANWDVVGLDYDNIGINAAGKIIRLDSGGALLYRAQGAVKGNLFGNTVGELQTLRSASMNKTAAKVFAGINDKKLVTLIDDFEARVKAQGGLGVVNGIIDKSGMTAGSRMKLKATLSARYNDILAQREALKVKLAQTVSSASSVTSRRAAAEVVAGKTLLPEFDDAVLKFKKSSSPTPASFAAWEAARDKARHHYRTYEARWHSLPETGKRAVKHYTCSGYMEMNDKLRKLAAAEGRTRTVKELKLADFTRNGVSVSGSQLEALKRVDRAMSRSARLEEDKILVRFQRVIPPGWEKGGVYQFQGFGSTAEIPLIDFDRGVCAIEFKVKKGQRLIAGMNESENEYLLPHGTKVRVLETYNNVKDRYKAGIERKVIQVEILDDTD